MTEVRNPFHVRCATCKHVWVGFYVPMEMAKCAEVMGALHCPMCGADASRITMAPPGARPSGQP